MYSKAINSFNTLSKPFPQKGLLKMENYRLIYRNNESCDMNLLLCSERNDDISFENVTQPCLIKLVYISVEM